MGQVKEQPKRRKRQVLLRSGVEFTPELEKELAAEAEHGYDLSKARRRFLSQPVLADGESRTKLTVRLPVSELNAVRQRAEEEGRSLSSLAREALERYLKS